MPSSILTFIESVDDFRRPSHIHYPLNEILFLLLSAVVSGADKFTTIQTFGQRKLDWLRQYYPYKSGIPDPDTLNRVLSKLCHRGFEKLFIDWVSNGYKLPNGLIINIDGKALRRSATKQEQQTKHSKGGKNAIHIVHAWSSQLKLCIGQYKTASKSNEINAIDALLDLLPIEGAIITIDSMGCQRKIATKIVKEKKSDYLLAVKGNQAKLEAAVTVAFNTACTYEQSSVQHDKAHGRIEERYCQVLDASLLPAHIRKLWTGLASLICVRARRHVIASNTITEYTRYYISSVACNRLDFNQLVRCHWGVENKLHWCLDVQFFEDASTKRKDNLPQNYSLILKVATNLLKQQTDKQSIPSRRFACGLSDKYREQVLKIRT